MTSPGEPPGEEFPGTEAGDENLAGRSAEPPADEAEDEERWLDDQAGPLVRPYVMTSGRMQPVRGKFDLVTMVEATGLPATPELGLGPEHQAVVRLCEQVLSVAEIAGHLKLPTVTVRVLLGDLLDKGLITVQDPHTDTDLMTDEQMYRAVIDGLHAL
ncbi:DUF742 domain-containing protein [Actinoallomurus sp. NBC_01490]|uniref:DUF742 domain-containing protein n=1 Tax=Actinoallomurus sp. NBC_01490 TaxID=2903557 RepID=UPI002E359BB8|nr:DUF742 domain-containing protein [Actinoallomurus sp. NBC_01490]